MFHNQNQPLSLTHQPPNPDPRTQYSNLYAFIAAEISLLPPDQKSKITSAHYHFFVEATIKYLRSDKCKKEVIANLGLSVEKGQLNCRYYPEGYYGIEEQRISPSSLFFVSGWVRNEVIAGETKVKIYKSEQIDEVEAGPAMVKCDGCGATTPDNICVQTNLVTTRTGAKVKAVLCNHCVLHSEDPNVRELGDAKKCHQDCDNTGCPHHFANPTELQRVQDLYARQTGTL